MNPVEHLLVAAVPVLAYVLVRDRELPTRRLLYVVLVGSQFPDLVDKPLALQWGLIPNGRMFLHSLVVAIPLSVALLLVVHRTTNVREGAAFVVAYLSHIAADFRFVLEPDEPLLHPNLVWPLGPTPEVVRVPVWAGPGGIYVTLWTGFSIALLLLTGYLLVRELGGDGSSRRPGFEGP